MNDKASDVKNFAEIPATCLTPRCNNAADTRGVCTACYHSHRRAVNAGSTTWQFLEERKLILPVVAKSVATIAREEAGLASDPNTSSGVDA